MMRRIAHALPTVILVVVANFFLLQLAPGDMADVIAGEAGGATPEYMASLREQYGLDKPVIERFASYAGKLAKLDLGYSFRNNMPVLDLILDRLPATLLLLASSMAVAVILGVLLGLISALFRGRWPDNVVSTLSTLGFATPLFWVGLMLIVLFSVHWRLLPSGGMWSTDVGGGFVERARDLLAHMALPVLTLSLFYVSVYTRVVRAAVLEIVGQDYVRTARAKGLARHRIVWRHVMRNAWLPLVTVTGLEIAALLGGAVTIETVFSWPGMARLAFDAVSYRDINLLMGVLFLSALVVIAMNLLIDFLYGLLDPRIDIR